MREDVENSGGKSSHAEREKHVAELRDCRVGQHALDVVLNETDRGGKDCGQRSDDGNCLHRRGREHKQRVRTRDHVDASCDHGCSMNERGYWRGAFHGIRQPDVERKLSRFSASSDKEQQSRGGDNGIADGEVAATSSGGHIDKAQRTKIPGDEEHPQQKSGIADSVYDERFRSGVARRLAMEIKTDQQIRT